jgi:hypothetical protein
VLELSGQPLGILVRTEKLQRRLKGGYFLTATSAWLAFMLTPSIVPENELGDFLRALGLACESASPMYREEQIIVLPPATIWRVESCRPKVSSWSDSRYQLLREPAG